MLTLTNSFHGTEYTTRKSARELDAICLRIGQGTATAADRAFARRVHAALCGSPGCTCGGQFGERPARQWEDA